MATTTRNLQPNPILAFFSRTPPAEDKTSCGTMGDSTPLSCTIVAKTRMDAKPATQVIIVFSENLLNDDDHDLAYFSSGQPGTYPSSSSSSSSSVISAVTMEPSLNIQTKSCPVQQCDDWDDNHSDSQSAQRHHTKKYYNQTRFAPDKTDDGDDGECSVSRSFVRDVATRARYKI
jgi:hypothetical protein